MDDPVGPTISIVIPAYNSAALLPATLRSVIDQTETDWEALIVDDCSTDDIASVVAGLADPRIRILRHAANAGASAARNTGIAAARGTFIAFLDADDSWLPTKLEKQLSAVLAQADPARSFCVTKTIVTMQDGAHLMRPVRAKRVDERMDEFIFVAAGFCQTSAFFASAELVRGVGGFRELPTGEDQLFAIDLCNAGAEYLLIDEPLTIYHDEMRPGRLSHAAGLAEGAQFIAGVRDTLSTKALLGYKARYLGAMMVRKHPCQGLSMLRRAVAAGAITRRYALLQIIRAFVSPAFYQRVRARFLVNRSGMEAGNA